MKYMSSYIVRRLCVGAISSACFACGMLSWCYGAAGDGHQHDQAENWPFEANARPVVPVGSIHDHTPESGAPDLNGEAVDGSASPVIHLDTTNITFSLRAPSPTEIEQHEGPIIGTLHLSGHVYCGYSDLNDDSTAGYVERLKTADGGLGDCYVTVWPDDAKLQAQKIVFQPYKLPAKEDKRILMGTLYRPYFFEGTFNTDVTFTKLEPTAHRFYLQATHPVSGNIGQSVVDVDITPDPNNTAVGFVPSILATAEIGGEDYHPQVIQLVYSPEILDLIRAGRYHPEKHPITIQGWGVFESKSGTSNGQYPIVMWNGNYYIGDEVLTDIAKQGKLIDGTGGIPTIVASGLFTAENPPALLVPLQFEQLTAQARALLGKADRSKRFLVGFGAGMGSGGRDLIIGIVNLGGVVVTGGVDAARSAKAEAMALALDMYQINTSGSPASSQAAQGDLAARREKYWKQAAVAFETARDTGNTLVAFVVTGDQTEVILVEGVLTGDTQILGKLPDPYRTAIQYVVTELPELRDQYAQMDPYDQGVIFGRIALEVVSIVVPATKGAEVAELVSRAKFLESLATRLTALKDANLAKAASVFRNAGLAAAKTEDMCFIAGTPVLTPVGLRPINSIRPGDQVLSRNPSTGVESYHTVKQTFITHPNRLIHIRYRVLRPREPRSNARRASFRKRVRGGSTRTEDPSDPDPDSMCEVICTPQHPFWATNHNAFIDAGHLTSGDHLHLASGGVATVVSARLQDAGVGKRFTTYNLDVAEDHTYFAGREAVLVHNLGEPCEIIEAFYLYLTQGAKTKLTPWLAFKHIIESGAKEVALPDLKGYVLRRMADGCFNDIYKAATKYTDVPSVKDVYKVMTGRFGTAIYKQQDGTIIGYGLQNHHTVPKWLQDQLLIPAVENDDCPALLLGQDAHTGAGGSSFHNILDKYLKEGEQYDPKEIMAGLESAYRDFGRSDVWNIAKDWLKSKGIQ